MLEYVLHRNTLWVMDWIERMTKRFGVDHLNGVKDWGQALELYGDYEDRPRDIPTDKDIATAKRWERGPEEWPGALKGKDE